MTEAMRRGGGGHFTRRKVWFSSPKWPRKANGARGTELKHKGVMPMIGKNDCWDGKERLPFATLEEEEGER